MLASKCWSSSAAVQVHKLYGHGNDVYCVAASPDGRYIASACVAKTAPFAAIWVWTTASGGWRGVTQLQVGPVPRHGRDVHSQGANFS